MIFVIDFLMKVVLFIICFWTFNCDEPHLLFLLKRLYIGLRCFLY
jgi:hypothetical protein